jgi:hypothetical protein
VGSYRSTKKGEVKKEMNRKVSNLLLLGLALTSVLVTAVMVKAEPLYGEMELFKPPSGPSHPEWGPLSWSGTISGDINGNIYFYKTGSKVVGQAKHFWEVWLITDAQGDMLLMGTDEGVVSVANLKFRMNGVVTDAAPRYEHLNGRNVHMSGQVIPISQTEKQALGIFRVN